MITYVAFLRGINVGGNNIISMKDLADAFIKMGFTSVKTYINSGNVIFQSNIENRKEIAETVGKPLTEILGFTPIILIRTEQEIGETIKHFPEIFKSEEWKHNVIFLGESIDNSDLLKRFILKPDIELNSYFAGVLYWSAKWEFGTRSTMMKLSKYPEYQEMTVRSIGTVQKIREIMNKMGQ